MLFWALWIINGVTAAIAIWFFIAGAADGSVSSYNIGLWLGILACCFAILAGSYALRKTGHAILASLVLAPVAAGTVLYALFIAVVIGSGTSWN